MHELLTSGWIPDLIRDYGLWVLFVVIMLECTGIPLPGETALVATAIYAGSSHRFQIFEVVGVAAAAAIIGDNMGYLVGRTVGYRLVVKYGKAIGLNETRLKIGRYLFLQHGGKIVFFGRFVAFLRVYAALLAGVDKMPWRNFLVMNALGGICWASLFGGGAYYFGKEILEVVWPVALSLLIGAIVLIVAGIIYARSHEKELAKRADAALAELG